MKKILHLTHFFPPKKGGIEKVAMDIITVLSEKYENIVLCFNEKNFNSVDFINNSKIIRIAKKLSLFSQPISFLYFFKLKKLLLEFKPDVIHIHAPSPLFYIYMFFLNYKGNIILHWHSDIIGKGLAHLIIRPFEIWIINRSDKIIATTETYAKNSRYLISHLNKTHVVTNIVDLKRFQNIKNQVKIANYDVDKINVLFVGRHVKYKGLKFLIEVAKLDKNNDINFHICGSGPETKKLKKSSKTLKNVFFHGIVNNENLLNFYKQCDIFAFPSIFKSEAFGIALAEAMYFGLPAITFNLKGSGVKEVNINKFTGLVVDLMNIKDFYLSINKIYQRKEEYSKNASNHIKKNYMLSKMKEQLKKIYNEI